MDVLESISMICACCMEKHTVKRVTITEKNVINGEQIQYTAEYFYCENADEFFADERQIVLNDAAMKRAYREIKNGVCLRG